MKKECTHCKKIKKLSEFPRDKTKIDGRHSWCKVCERERSRKYYHSIDKFRKRWKWRNDRLKPHHFYRRYKYSAQKRNLDFKLSFRQFMTFWQKPCSYCEDEIKTIGLDRIDNNKGYEIGNIVSCCSFCNFAKRRSTREQFIQHCRKVIESSLKK